MTTIVIRQVVPVDRRSGHAAALFGDYFPMQFEPVVYAITSELSREYRGGYWEFYTLSNEGFYMAPDADAPFKVSCQNGYAGVLSADALGITACLYAYSHLSFSAGEAIAGVYARQYHLLREYVMDCPEAAAILSATD